MIEYARSFKLTMKESFKRVTQWAAFYHTSRKSWYPKPKEAIPFSKVPMIKPLPIVDMSKANCDIMWNWASAWQCDCGQCAKRRPWQSMAFSLILYFNHR